MSEEKKTEEPTEEDGQKAPDLDSMSDESRREFLGKLLAGAGGVLATGLLASALDAPASAAPLAVGGLQRRANPPALHTLGHTPLRYENLPNGFGLRMGSPELTQTLVNEHLIPVGHGQTSYSLTIDV